MMSLRCSRRGAQLALHPYYDYVSLRFRAVVAFRVMRTIIVFLCFSLVGSALAQHPSSSSNRSIIYGIVFGPNGKPAKGILPDCLAIWRRTQHKTAQHEIQ